jgi:FdhD protein
MNSNYKVTKFRSNNSKEFNDQISIEEPLEIILKYKDKEDWIENTISITMRTPGDDEDLVTGFLFNERVIEKISHIENIEASGEPVGQYKLQNKVIITINNSENVDIDKIKRNFLTNSSCGVCGKTSLESLEIIKKDKILKSIPKIHHEIIMKSPDILRQNQSEFSKTGGIHASGLFKANGEIIAVKEDVGRHNAADKVIGQQLLLGNYPISQPLVLLLSGRVSFDMIQKTARANISAICAVGMPTSLAIESAQAVGIKLYAWAREDSVCLY